MDVVMEVLLAAAILVMVFGPWVIFFLILRKL